MKKIILSSVAALLMGGVSYGVAPKHAAPQHVGSSVKTYKEVAYLCAYSGPSGLAIEGNDTQNTPYSWGEPRYTSGASQTYDESLQEMEDGCTPVDLSGLCMQGEDVVECSGNANAVYAYCNPSQGTCTSGHPKEFSDYNEVTSW